MKSYVLNFVVTEEVKTWTQGIVGTQWNESNWYVTECVLHTENIKTRTNQNIFISK